MLHQLLKPGRFPRLALIVAVGLTVVGLAMSLPALALPSLFGGKLFYAGGDVTINVLHSDTAYDEVLQLRSAVSVLDVGYASKVGSTITLTQQQLADLGIGLGDELQFGLHVLNTNQNFLIGPGTRNIDGLDHAYVRQGRSNVFVAFEDLLGGGDRDYNDVVFRFSGVTTNYTRPVLPRPDARIGSASAPTGLALMLTGIGLLALANRKR